MNRNIISQMKKHSQSWFFDWLNLPEAERIVRIERSYEVLRQVADKQLLLLEQFEKSSSHRKTEAHFYFLKIVRSFWRDADFALWLGKSQYGFYATYPVRTMMEKMLKIFWFSDQDPDKQDLIARKELLKQCLDLYRSEKDYGRPGGVYKRLYERISRGDFPSIDEVKRKDLEAFPSYEVLCKKSKLVDGDKLYHSYRTLSGLPHGDLLSVSRIHGEEEVGEYRRVIMFAVRFCVEMIKAVDFHLERATHQDIIDAIVRADEIRRGLA